MKITYHCDDIGLTPNVTQRILSAWREGLITSFSIIANGLEPSQVNDGLHKSSNIDARIAVHLNLSDGKAISAHHKQFVSETGYFNGSFFGLLIAWLKSSADDKASLLNAIEEEWRAQIQVVKGLIGPREVTVIDGHTHIHMLPFLFPIAARLAKEFGIPEIRVSDEIFHLSSTMKENISPVFVINILKHVVLRICSIKAKKVCQQYQLAYQQKILGILYSGNMTAAAASSGIERANKSGITSLEVLFHIGRATREEMTLLGEGTASTDFSVSIWRDIEYIELKQLRSE
jgi:chitin disaccharide deacetylase